MALKDLKIVGKSVRLRDLDTHVRGQTTYYEDVRIPRMLHLKMYRSPHPHAKILKIDTTEAAKQPGVVCVLTHEDMPGKKTFTPLAAIGVAPEDEPILAFDKVRWKGEPIAAVVAESEAAAKAAAPKVKVTFEELPAVFDVEEALKAEAPIVTPWGKNYYQYPDDHAASQIRYGDVERAFAEADHIVEDKYQTKPIEHAPLETTGCVAKPEGNGRYTVYTNIQALYFALDNTAAIVGLSPAKLRFVGGTVGGGFGGKVDIQVEPIATLAAIKTKRPVKYKYSREDEMRVSSTRAAWRIYVKDGVMNDGRIVARKITTYQDAGAYIRLSSYGTMKHAGHMPGPYTIPNVSVDAYCVFTNRPPSSAMRGFGVMSGSYAIELQMDKIAAVTGVDPWQLRLINAYRNGDMKAHRKAADDAALVETIQAAAQLAGQALPADFAAMSSDDRKGG